MANHAEFNTVIDTEDHTNNLLPKKYQEKPSEAQQEGFNTAKENAEADRELNGANPYKNEPLGEQNIKDAQASAEANARTEKEMQPEQHGIAKNDTSNAGKVRTSKSQLDPSGEDPISSAEISRAAIDGVNVKGGTSVTDEEAAQRGKNPGTAEEENSISTANGNLDPSKLVADEEAVHANNNENDHTGQGGLAETSSHN